MAIICDEKHDDTTPGLPSLQLRGTTRVGDDDVNFDLRVQVSGKHFCQEHYVSKILSKLDFAKLGQAFACGLLNGPEADGEVVHKLVVRTKAPLSESVGDGGEPVE